MEGHFSTCEPVGHQMKRRETSREFSVARTHHLTLGWKEEPLISYKGPFQGRGSSSDTVYVELQRHHFSGQS